MITKLWVFYVKFLSSKIFDDKLFGYSYLLLTQSARIKVERIDRYQFYLMKFADFLEDRASVTDRGVLYFPQRTVPRVPFRGWFRASVDSDLRGLPRGWHVFGLDILAASAWWFAVVLAFCVLRLGVEKFIILIYKILIDRAKIKSINSIFVFPLLKKKKIKLKIIYRFIAERRIFQKVKLIDSTHTTVERWIEIKFYQLKEFFFRYRIL